MARKYSITRTVQHQNVTALVFDKNTAEAFNKTIPISPVITDPAKLARVVAKTIDNDNEKFIEVVDVEVVEKCYGISVEDFMAHAVELDPKTRHALSEN